jgi:AsmA-like C-terminal region
MRHKTVMWRLRKLLLALLACLLFAVLAPLYLADRRPDEPFAISSVVASPRDMHVLSQPIRLSDAPDLVLNRGVVYSYTTSQPAPGGSNSSIVLDGPVFTLNAAGLRVTQQGTGEGATGIGAVAPLIEQIVTLGFDLITIKRGTLHVTAFDGTLETITDIQAEVTGRRKGQIAGRGTFTIRGQRLAFDATLGQSSDKRLPARWPLKATVKGALVEASVDGYADVGEDLQLVGVAEVSTTSLRRVGRWFGLPLHTTEGFNAATIKGQLTWARRVLAFEKAKITVDQNEASGRLALNVANERPQVDATLDFTSLNLTPYLEAARVQFFGFDLSPSSWSTFDLSLPLIRYVDADLRLSAHKISLKGYALGQGAATITAQAGKLQADITELEVNSGTASAQVTAIMSEAIPRYALRAKVENIDAGAATGLWFGSPVLSGRANLTAELTSVGFSPSEIIRRLSGKTSLTLSEGGRLALDLKALRSAAKAGDSANWGKIARLPIAIDQLEARALIIDGVAFADIVQAKSGTMGLGASGRFGFNDGNMELRLTVKQGMPTDRPLTAADIVGGDIIYLRGPWQEPVVRMEDGDAGLPPR